MTMTSAYKVANKSDIADGTVKVFMVENDRVAVCRVDNLFYAVADLCSHDGGPLGEGELVDHQIECPRHGARFDIETGKAMCFPAVVPIPVYKVEERGEEIWVSVPAHVVS
jgi:3-phenylpropionate/trans-cinnamate dioxygenase ferredoxin component